MQSPHSVILMRSIRLHQPLNVSGKRSAMPPGLQPGGVEVDAARLQAAPIAAATSGFWTKGNQ